MQKEKAFRPTSQMIESTSINTFKFDLRQCELATAEKFEYVLPVKFVSMRT